MTADTPQTTPTFPYKIPTFPYKNLTFSVKNDLDFFVTSRHPQKNPTYPYKTPTFPYKIPTFPNKNSSQIFSQKDVKNIFKNIPTFFPSDALKSSKKWCFLGMFIPNILSKSFINIFTKFLFSFTRCLQVL